MAQFEALIHLDFDVFNFCLLISSLEYKIERKFISHLGMSTGYYYWNILIWFYL